MKSILITLYLLVLAAELTLRYLNLRHLKLHEREVPEGFETEVTPDALEKASEYTVANSRVGLLESLFSSALTLLFIFVLLPWYDRFITGLAGSFILQGILFFLILHLVQSVLDIPFDLYRTFVLEKRFGFNTTTPSLFVADLCKSTVIGVILLAAVGAGAFYLIESSPQRWWLWVWLFLAALSLFLMYLSPYLIEPLFYKFEPVTEPGLEDEIRQTMEKAGLKVSRVLQMDASRRSRHSNAYFTGIGRTKRIVLFDTLIRQMSHGEIVAVLAHEVGHWKLGHIRNRLVLAQAGALAGSFGAWALLGWDRLPELAGMPEASFFARLVILSFAWGIVSFPFTSLFSWLSRRDEWGADRFGAQISGTPELLASALVKLNCENLSNLHPHPLYAAFYYSHPPTVQRVRRLRER